MESKALDKVYETYHKQMKLFKATSVTLAICILVEAGVTVLIKSKKDSEISALQEQLAFKSGELLSSTVAGTDTVSYDVVKLNLPDVQILEPGENIRGIAAPSQPFKDLVFYFTPDYKIAKTDQFIKGTSSTVIVYGSNMNLTDLVPELSGATLAKVTGSDRCVVSEGKTTTGLTVFSMIATQANKPFHLVVVSGNREAAYHEMYKVSGFGATFDKGYVYSIDDAALDKYIQVGSMSVLANSGSKVQLSSDQKTFQIRYSEDLNNTCILGRVVPTSNLEISRALNDNISSVREDLVTSGVISRDSKMELVTNTYPTWNDVYGSFARYVIKDTGKQKNLFAYTMFNPIEKSYVLMYTVSDVENSVPEKVLHAVVTEIMFK